MVGVKRPQFFIRGFSELGGILDHEFKLLRQATADDCVVFAEAHRFRLPRQQLFADKFVYQPTQLFWSRIAQPLARPGLFQPPQVALADVYGFGFINFWGIAIQPVVAAKHHRSDEGKMQQRLVPECAIDFGTCLSHVDNALLWAIKIRSCQSQLHLFVGEVSSSQAFASSFLAPLFGAPNAPTWFA